MGKTPRCSHSGSGSGTEGEAEKLEEMKQNKQKNPTHTSVFQHMDCNPVVYMGGLSDSFIKVMYQISCISDFNFMIHNSSKVSTGIEVAMKMIVWSVESPQHKELY